MSHAGVVWPAVGLGEGEAWGTQLLCGLGLRCDDEVGVSGVQGLCDL